MECGVLFTRLYVSGVRVTGDAGDRQPARGPLTRRGALRQVSAWGTAGLGLALAACGGAQRKRSASGAAQLGFSATNVKAAGLPVRSWAPAVWGTGASATAAYVRRTDTGRVVALSSVCPHLGCRVRYHPEARQFVCPCHNGVFSFDGALRSGPPPQGMFHLQAIVYNGTVYLSAA